MKNSEQDIKERYGLSRYDDVPNKNHGWRVSLWRRGVRHVGNFPDKKHGGKEKALRLAMQYRDRLVVRHRPISRKEACKIRRSNNNSGITGVCTYAKRYKLRDGTTRETWYWEASWPDNNGKAVSVNFSVKKYGEDVARSKAIKARRLGLERLEGVFWPSERGVVEAPVQQSPTGLQKKVRRVA